MKVSQQRQMVLDTFGGGVVYNWTLLLPNLQWYKNNNLQNLLVKSAKFPNDER